DILDPLSIHFEEQLELVSAKWVMPLRGTGRCGHLMEIARLFAMVQDDLLIKITKVVEHQAFGLPICGCSSSRSQTNLSSSSRAGVWRMRSMISAANAWINIRRAVSIPIPRARK